MTRETQEREPGNKVETTLRVGSFGVIQIRISDPRSLRSWCIKGADELVIRVDSSVPLMNHDRSDLGSLIRIQITPKECTLELSSTVTSFPGSSLYLEETRTLGTRLYNICRLRAAKRVIFAYYSRKSGKNLKEIFKPLYLAKSLNTKISFQLHFLGCCDGITSNVTF